MKIRFRFIKLLLCSSIFFQVSLVLAATPEERIQENINNSLPQYNVESIKQHDASGLYIVQLQDGPALYSTENGQYFLVGDLYRLDENGLINETEEAKLAQIETIPENQMIIYAATGEEKAHVSVFTDITCGYCRMLHSEVSELNDLGITVRYLAFPRAGIDSEPYQQMVSIWCSDNPQKWMTNAKLGKKVPENDCENPVADQYSLGQSIGVRGTPTLVLSTGKLVPGYLPAAKLAKELGL